MSSALQPPGPKPVGGRVDTATAQLFLTDEDGSEVPQPVIFIPGTLVDNGDGTYDIIPVED